MRARSFLIMYGLLVASLATADDEPVFSGPQVGEKLASLPVNGVFGDDEGEKFDLVKQAEGKSMLLVFFHQKSRPAFGLMNTVMRFAHSRTEQDLVAEAIFLTDDQTEMSDWMRRVAKHFTKGIRHTISTDGQEGPGAYGLNRNVALTVLVAKDDKVTANFALVQPSEQADGPKIFKAIVDVTGGGEVPSIAKFSRRAYTGQPTRKPARANQQDPKLRPLLAPVINMQATPEQVDKAAAAIEAYCEKHPAAKKQVGDISRRIINAGKLKNYGTLKAREYLQKWAKQFSPPAKSDTKPKHERG